MGTKILNPFFWGLLTYILLLLVIAISKKKFILNPKLRLIRSMFPSWRFFDQAAPYPVAYYRYQSSLSLWSEWIPLIQKPIRRLKCIFLNPKGQIFLAKQTLVQNFVDEVQILDSNLKSSFFDNVTSKLIQQLVIVELKKQYFQKEKIKYQFKIDFQCPPCLSIDSKKRSPNTYLTSPEFIFVSCKSQKSREMNVLNEVISK